MKIDILTLFPEICRAPLNESIMKRAQENKILDLRLHNLRHWTTAKQHVVDDAPIGGGERSATSSTRQTIGARTRCSKCRSTGGRLNLAAGKARNYCCLEVMLRSPHGEKRRH